MCKTCFKQSLINKGDFEWESTGLSRRNVSVKATLKCLWKLRVNAAEESRSDTTKGDLDELSSPEGTEEEHPVNSEGESNPESEYPVEPDLTDHAKRDPETVGDIEKIALRSSAAEDHVLERGKLEAPGRNSSPVIRGRRPFFYLPTDDTETPDSTEVGTQSSIPLDLENDPDLFPVRKSLPSSTEEESQPSDPSTSTEDKGKGSQGSPDRRRPPSGTSESEANIRDRILECLSRAKSRSSGVNSGSFEAGLYRLESLVKEFEGNQVEAKRFLLSRRLSKESRPDKYEDKAESMPVYRDAGTLTDVCAGENLPEVEIISLVQEQIPAYKLRADVISEFSGYDNEGWTVPFPALKESEVEALSPEQAEGALAYFVLCGNRVSQMTRTYHDIEAVTRLLQEKEKDLELAARIGQQLLARNKGLEEKNAALEAELGSSAEKITQLRHELLMKTDLLQIYTNDVDESSVETTPTSLRHINVDLLQRRVQSLESENVYLREEASQLASDTQHCEEKEKELVTDVIKQLNEANLQVNQLGDELSKKIEDNLRLQEETTQLLAQVVELQATAKRLTRENEEYSSLVGVARECQQELTTELAELKEKYAEVLDLLHDTQEQLRRAQKKNFPGSRGVHLGGGSLFSSFHSGSDSIASELHSLSSGEEPADKADGTKSLSRVFDTVRLSSKLSNSLPPLGHSGGSVYSTPTKQASQIHSHLGTPLHGVGGRYSPYFGGSGMSMGCSSGIPSLDSGAESDGSFPTDSEDNYPASRPGVPGWPGTPDLDSCLRRLGPQDRTSLAYLPYGCRTPDSIMSTGSLKSGMSSYSGQDWKLPQKLQIVKPIEGSLTLHQWSRLATPHLGGLLEEKEGIAVKGATNADLNLEVYSMSDLEEDEEEEEKAEAESKGEEDDDDESKGFPGKQFMSTSGVFTYTNSTVLHPDELTSLTPSLRPSQMSALPTVSTVAPSIPTSTPAHGSSLPPSRRGSTATFSTNVGIAKHLRERGFSESHNSAGMAATATPANSPDESRACTPEPHAYRLPGLEDLTKHFHAGASFLRRTFYGSEYSSKPSSPPECSKINLMERVQAFGVERFVGPSGYPQSVGGVVTSRYPATPPLLQLSNLIRSGAKTAAAANESSPTASTSTVNGKGSIMSAPKITSPGERRPEKPMGAPLGIPGQPGAGHLDSRLTQLKPGQRTDLGTVGNVGSRPRPSNLGTIPLGKKDEKMGTVGWTSLGRKGGLL